MTKRAEKRNPKTILKLPDLERSKNAVLNSLSSSDSWRSYDYWAIVRKAAADCGFGTVAPHDLRRTCARPCHQAGGELEQIQLL